MSFSEQIESITENNIIMCDLVTLLPYYVCDHNDTTIIAPKISQKYASVRC